MPQSKETAQESPIRSARRTKIKRVGPLVNKKGVVRLLLDRGADPTIGPLVNKRGVVRLLLDRGADPTIGPLVNKRGVVRLLLDRGADPTSRTWLKWRKRTEGQMSSSAPSAETCSRTTS